MKKIRLGMVRGDTHGYYFGAMMQKCDPLLLQKNNYVVHHYFSNIFDPAKLTMPFVPGFEISCVYDPEPEKAQAFAETFLNKPEICEKAADMLKHIDAVFIADCDGSGADHLKLAEPFIKNGIPAFIDKPFALTLADAGKIVKLAEKHKVPIFNSSILSQVPAADKFKLRFDEIISAPSWPVPEDPPEPRVGLGVVKGVGGAFSQELAGKVLSGGIEERMAYIIHGVALALNLFGHGVEWVEAMGSLPLEYLHLHLKNGTEVMIMNTAIDIFPETCSFFASAYTKYGVVHSPPIGDPEFIYGAEKIIKLLRQMIKTGKPPVAYHEIIEHIAVVEAGQLAQKTGQRVFL
jgi:hypothetical protein